MNEKIWCPLCGKWSDHGSAQCPSTSSERSTSEVARAKLVSNGNISYKHPRYMIGTTAQHKLGDISRPGGDLCLIHARDGQDYIGNWVTGLGFALVRFPVATTRRLTTAEKNRWNGKQIGINGSWGYALKIR